MTIERLNVKCVECLLNKHLKSVPDLFDDKGLEYTNGIREIITKADVSMSAPEVVAQINEFKKGFGIVDDFTEIKKFYNDFLMGFEKEIESEIQNADNPLETAVKYAMAGNYIDLGALEKVDEQKLRETLDKSNEISIDSTLTSLISVNKIFKNLDVDPVTPVTYPYTSTPFPSNAVKASASIGYVKLPVISAPSIFKLKYLPEASTLPTILTYVGVTAVAVA